MGTQEEEIWQPAKTRWSEKAYLIYNQDRAAKKRYSFLFYFIFTLQTLVFMHNFLSKFTIVLMHFELC